MQPALRAMGISRDHWHRCFKTGGKRSPYHKKQKYGLGCPAASAKIGIHTVHIWRGSKHHALRLDVGELLLGFQVLYTQNKDC